MRATNDHKELTCSVRIPRLGYFGTAGAGCYEWQNRRAVVIRDRFFYKNERKRSIYVWKVATLRSNGQKSWGCKLMNRLGLV